MIEFRVLGGVDLRDPDGGELDSILHQPKRLALLAYLAVASPRGFHRRDTLLGLFWPELDQEHARNALGQAVHVLRRSMGQDVLVNRGAGELGLEAAGLWCDACAFEQALGAGRLEEALELYRGELLRGLFVSEMLEFERWLDDERTRLRERGSAAAWKLSEAEERAGHPGSAVHWARRAAALSADDESALCRLVSLLDRVGDRAGPLRVYDEFANRLAAEYDSEPAPETQALIRAVRERGGSAVAPARAARAADQRGPAPASVVTGTLEAPQMHPNNLPAQSTPLIGRERELARLCSRLLADDVRLLTLTGPGGVGKTRLALGAAAELLERFPAGIYFVDLTSLGDPGQAIHAVARALRVRETAGQQVIDTLTAALRGRAVLLVLDNFEHLMGAASLVAELLAACPLVKILVTSRGLLHIDREHGFPVPPLALPQTGLLMPFELLSTYPALELFIDRAQAVRPDFSFTERNAAAVAEICIQLEGLPLALELAAARIKGLTPDGILARLGSPLALLKARALELSHRHQSLRRTIAWSYDLLDVSEKTIFRRLAVFAAPCSEHAAKSVCDSSDGVDLDVPQGLCSLADRSLLRRGLPRVRGEPRFGMLSAIREFAVERLTHSGELDVVQGRHAAYYLELVERAEPELIGARQIEWFDGLDEEQDDLRAALAWMKATSAVELGLRMAGALGRFWEVRGYPSEGRGWLEEFLAVAATDGSALPVEIRAKALNWAGALARGQGDHARAIAPLTEALALYRRLGDKQRIAYLLNNLGNVALDQKDYDKVAILYGESLEIKRELGDKKGIALSLNNLGHLALEQGDYQRAAALHRESLELKRELADQWGIAMSLDSLGDIAVEHDDCRQAAGFYAESLELYRDLGDRRGIAVCLEGSAKVACRRGDFICAAQLFAAAETLRETIGAPIPPVNRAMYDRKIEAARAGLDQQAFIAAWSEGRSLPIEEAIGRAQEIFEGVTVPTARAG